MNLYMLTHDKDIWPEFYSHAVVRAESEDDARRTFPDSEFIERILLELEDRPSMSREEFEEFAWDDSWVEPADVKVMLIGIALEGDPPGVVYAHYEAYPFDSNPYEENNP